MCLSFSLFFFVVLEIRSMVAARSCIMKLIAPRERPLLETKGLSRKFLLEYLWVNSPYFAAKFLRSGLATPFDPQSSSALFSSDGSKPGRRSEILPPWRWQRELLPLICTLEASQSRLWAKPPPMWWAAGACNKSPFAYYLLWFAIIELFCKVEGWSGGVVLFI